MDVRVASAGINPTQRWGVAFKRFLLKAAGLVTDRRDAQWVRYRRVRLRSPSAQRIVDAVLAATKTTTFAKRTITRNLGHEELTT